MSIRRVDIKVFSISDLEKCFFLFFHKSGVMYKTTNVEKEHADFLYFMHYPRFLPTLNGKTIFLRSEIIKTLISAPLKIDTLPASVFTIY